MASDMDVASDPTKKVLLKDLNTLLTCPLCNGYLIEAITFDLCLHSYCRSCVLNHFETTKQETCPKCDKKKAIFRPDHQLQALVFKMVPGLFGKETQRREDFYRSSVRASSTCSEDSILGDVKKDQDKWLSAKDGTSGQNTFFSPEDPISLSLEFYQSHLDETDINSDKLCTLYMRQTSASAPIKKLDDEKLDTLDKSVNQSDSGSDKTDKKDIKVKADRRYLQCPAAVSMSHLQKFLRMKYALSSEHKVDIIYEGEVLPLTNTLMDVAYTYKWTKLKPMRFFYRIFTTLKVQPIKIINTANSNGSKQLQIVPVRSNSTTTTVAGTAADLEAEKNKEQFVANLKLQSKHKSNSHQQQPAQIFAEKLEKTKSKSPRGSLNTNAINTNTNTSSVFEYENEEDEEIKRFAESRDREWARMRHEEDVTTHVANAQALDTKTPSQDSGSHHVKKRKKSKHSKGDAKKPKIHAEITDVQPESIKLKVKLTPAHQHNGHKHKHHKSSSSSPISTKSIVVQSKGNHHKEVKDLKDVKDTKEVKELVDKDVKPAKKQELVRKLNDICIKKADKDLKKEVKEAKKPVVQSVVATQHPGDVALTKPVTTVDTKKKEDQKTFLKTFQSNANTRQPGTGTKVESVASKADKKPMITYPSHTKQNFEKKIASLKQQAFNKQMSAKVGQQQQQQQKVANSKVNLSNHGNPNEGTKQNLSNLASAKEVSGGKKVSFSEKPHILNSQHSQYPSGFTVTKVEQGVKRKADFDNSNLDERPCLEITVIHPKPAVNNGKERPKSPKIHIQSNQKIVSKSVSQPKVKRPPPATIPLDRIKKSCLKASGVGAGSNGSKLESGALDLTKSNKNGISGMPGLSLSGVPGTSVTTLNGMKFPTSVTSSTSTATTPITNSLTANLQMLSKVAALQHSKQGQPGIPGNQVTQTVQSLQPTLTIPSATISTGTGINTSATPKKEVRHITVPGINKEKQIPNLQTIRIPQVNTLITQSSSNLGNQSTRPTPSNTPTTPRTIANLANLPKLNEINKSSFNNRKWVNNHNNNLKGSSQRSNNQNMIRNIPNPSMLVRQHNQSRINAGLTNGQQGQGQTQSPSPSQGHTKHNLEKTSPPKILNPLAKENTTVASISNNSSNNNLKDNSKDTKDTMQSLMSKMLDQSKGQIMVTASTAST